MGDTNSTHVGSLILSTCKKWDQKYYVTIYIESNKDKFGHVGAKSPAGFFRVLAYLVKFFWGFYLFNKYVST